MGRRALLAALVAAAPVADAAGSHALAFWALAAALPVAFWCGLEAFGDYLEQREDGLVSLQALLWIPALVLLLAAAAARGPAVAAASVPRLGVTALVGCVCVLALEAALAAGCTLQRRAWQAPAAAEG